MKKDRHITIVSTRTWKDLVLDLKRVALNGDSTILPYINAQVSQKIVDPENIKPLSLYAVRDKITFQQKLHRLFLEEYRINTLDQDGNRPDFTFQLKGEKGYWTMAPPIVEVSAADGNIPILLDGEHRFQMARIMKKKVRVIWIENIPREYPVVGIPASWKEVKIYKRVPKLLKKRHFRYQRLTDFPDISGFSNVKVTGENFRYFFYRNLNPICTSGIRETKE